MIIEGTAGDASISDNASGTETKTESVTDDMSGEEPEENDTGKEEDMNDAANTEDGETEDDFQNSDSGVIEFGADDEFSFDIDMMEEPADMMDDFF